MTKTYKIEASKGLMNDTIIGLSALEAKRKVKKLKADGWSVKIFEKVSTSVSNSKTK